MEFDQIKYASLLILVIVMIIRLSYLISWKKKGRKAFADNKFVKSIFKFEPLKNFTLNNIILIISVFLITIALIDVLGGSQEVKVQRQGSDVVFALDLSNSMNTEDVVPSRLEKAKKIIESTLNKLAGDRVGLIVFSDKAYTVSPLTQDYNSILNFLPSLDPYLLPTQGTDLGSPVKEAANMLNDNDLTSKTLVVLSDGEDHAQDLSEAISIAKKGNIKVSTIGLGTSKGGFIPDERNYSFNGLVLDGQGNPVISKIEDVNLKKLAESTEGKYYYGQSSDQTSQSLINDFSQLQKQDFQEKSSYTSEHYFQWFLGLALLLLIILSLTNIKSDFNI